MPNLKRLYLLSEAEIEDLYARPEFNADEREIYFALNPIEQEALAEYANTKTRVFFILQLGYFKAKNQFFTFSLEEVRDDVNYILSQLFNKTGLALSGRISREYISFQKRAILQFFDYHHCLEEPKLMVEAHLSELLKYYPHCQEAFCQLLIYFENTKIVIPSYRTLQDRVKLQKRGKYELGIDITPAQRRLAA